MQFAQPLTQGKSLPNLSRRVHFVLKLAQKIEQSIANMATQQTCLDSRFDVLCNCAVGHHRSTHPTLLRVFLTQTCKPCPEAIGIKIGFRLG